MSDAPDAAALLEERPDLRSALAAALAAEEAADGEPWTFDDIDADSGSFGELVSRGIVESSGDGYRLKDPTVVQGALHEEAESAGKPIDEDSDGLLARGWHNVDRRASIAIAAALAVVVGIRLLPWPNVFPGKHVVLSGNDPYFYRYWVEHSIAGSGTLAPEATGGEPLLVASLATIADALGGVPAVGAVMAWYPVVAAVLSAYLLYLVAVRVSHDRRVGLATVVLLGVIPAHALRTSLGYADHHALDYLFLSITTVALVWLLTRSDEDQPLVVGVAVVGLGLGTAGQVLAWEAGALVLGAVAVLVFVQLLVDLRSNRSPLSRQGPVIVGLGLGAVMAGLVHLGLGWQSTAVAATPTLLFAGAVAVVVTGHVANRFDVSSRALAILTVGVGLLVVAGSSVLLPDLWATLLTGIERLTEAGRQAAETRSLVSAATVGSLTQLGFLLAFALPAQVWISAKLFRGSPGGDRWTVPTVFGWYFLGLALFQIRFVGEFAGFAALFGGLSFVWLSAAVDVTTAPAPLEAANFDWRPSMPSARTAGAVLALFVLVGGMGALQTPVKIGQVAIDEPTYETAVWLDEYADERGWTSQEERYVFSEWGRNRVFNYFVNGDSRHYSFAWRRYADMVGSTDSGYWYSVLSDRAGFIVTSDQFNTPPRMLHYKLHRAYGSSQGTFDGLAHFQLLYVAEGGAHAAFRPVPGATLTGSGPANARVSAETVVDAGTREVGYERRGRTNATGQFTLGVANPGTYDVRIGDSTTTVTVTESDVHAGNTVRVASG